MRWSSSRYNKPFAFDVNYYAHTAVLSDGSRAPETEWQFLRVHLANVATLAEKFGAAFGMGPEGKLAGLLHDLGKYQPGFQQYLRIGSPRTPHAAVGAAVLERHSRMLANVVASHHAGLNDWPELEPKLKVLVSLQKDEFKGFLALMAEETSAQSPSVPEDRVKGVSGELRLRLLFSALVDADYLDTEAFYLRFSGQPTLRGSSRKIHELADLLRGHVAELSVNPEARPLNELRRQINEACEHAGENGIGIFSLTVPTGGGKTLASAMFALRHAVTNGMERVIYVIPYTSIIEQNARVFERIFGEAAVLEHHSLADWNDDGSEDEENLSQRKKLAAENWDAPFIVTTNVQFFESLHSHRPGACRKLHRLLNSVIIFDECQTFPLELLAPTLEGLKALVALGRTSLVFCTATQPALQQRAGFAEGFERIVEIIPDELKLNERREFRRTKLLRRREPISIRELCMEVATRDRALVVLNTRRHAWEIFSQLESPDTFHLSTLMCPAHRTSVLDEIKSRLNTPSARCIVVSTQLVEAGVDFDFPIVYRAIAPLDSIIQAAGRCNREGKALTPGEVIVFQLEDAQSPGGTYKRGAKIAEECLPDELEGNFAPKIIRGYFEALYQLTNRDKHNIQRLCEAECYRQIGEKYRWIESDSEMVLTDYSERGKELQQKAMANEFVPLTRKQLRTIARHCINLRKDHVERELIRSPKLVRLRNGLVITQASYDMRCGYNHFGDTPPDILMI